MAVGNGICGVFCGVGVGVSVVVIVVVVDGELGSEWG